jgi:hypothetical protein
VPALTVKGPEKALLFVVNAIVPSPVLVRAHDPLMLPEMVTKLDALPAEPPELMLSDP